MSTSTDENPVFNFVNSGEIPVKQVVVNTNTLEKDSISQIISITRTPSANLSIDSTNACIGGIVEFRNASTKLGAYIDFGDGTTSDEVSNYIFHRYKAHGVYPVKYITYFNECSDTSNYSITVDGPTANFVIDPDQACKGTPIMFRLGDTTDVNSFTWSTDDGTILTGDSAIHIYDSIGYLYPKLTVTGGSGSCTIEDTLNIYVVKADFNMEAEAFCDQMNVFFRNTSTASSINYWDFGNGVTDGDINGSQSYSPGNYQISLRIISTHGCSDSIRKELVIHPDPELQIEPVSPVCPGESATLQASGGHVILWSPSENIDNPASYTPIISPTETNTYTAFITDTITQCNQSDSIQVLVLEGFIPGKITVFPTDSSIIVGDTVRIIVYDSLNRELTYLWTPDVQISCNDCKAPLVQPLRTTTYLLEVSDTNQCSSFEEFEVFIEVTEEYKLGLPEAFTPNGDGVNDEMKVNGWGIKELLEFRIYNRWGNEVFFTDDINLGWDGTFNGKPQSIDSYAYSIKAEMWNDEVVIEKGTFSLLR